MPDTLSANVSASYREIIERTIAQMPQSAPMLSLAKRVKIPKGHNVAQIPRVTSTSTVQTPVEGDEIVNSSQFTLGSTTITPTFRAIKVRIHTRAQNYSREDLVRLVSSEMALSQGQDIDTDLTGEFQNWHTDNDVGATNTDLTLATLRRARRTLQAVSRANGGPPRGDIVTVLAPIPSEDVITDLGVQGVVSSNNPWIPSGLSEQLIRKFMITEIPLVGTSVFVDGYMTENGSGDFLCAMFGREALHWAVSMDWQMETFKESSWPGVILRSLADYNSGIGGYPHHGSQITADGG